MSAVPSAEAALRGGPPLGRLGTEGQSFWNTSLAWPVPLWGTDGGSGVTENGAAFLQKLLGPTRLSHLPFKQVTLSFLIAVLPDNRIGLLKELYCFLN